MLYEAEREVDNKVESKKVPAYFLKKIGGNEYFDSFAVYDKILIDDYYQCVGVVEDHCRQVKERYYVGWYYGGHYVKEKAVKSSPPFDCVEDAVYFTFFGEVLK